MTSRISPTAPVQEEDILGDLDGFQAASRHGSRQGYREDDNEGWDQDASQEDRVGHGSITMKKSRQSLSDRTVESLAQTPRRRQTNFFTPESQTQPSTEISRFGAASNPKRPGTSDGISRHASNDPSTPAATRQSALPSRGSTTGQIGKRSFSANPTSGLPTPGRRVSTTESTPSKLSRPQPTLMSGVRGVSKLNTIGKKAVTSKTDPDRTTTVAPPVQPPVPVVKPKMTKPAASKPASALERRAPTPAPRKAASSSSALREQIAKAKAAKKAAISQEKPSSNSTVADDFNFEFDLPTDPFNQAPAAGGGALRKRIDAARTDGRLNISAMGLTNIPETVLNMYDFNENSDSAIAWGEVVDLVRFVAADNDIEQIADDVFPDIGFDSIDVDDSSFGLQFSGIEVLDLHGNLLREVPQGLRQLQRLTVLNLSRNRLTCDVFDVISQISNLRDCRVADNALEGPLPESVGRLIELQNLELQGNMLTSLPETLGDLNHLHTLNISDNQLRSLPMAVLRQVPLKELAASKNMLQGTLFDFESLGHTTLQTLNVASNSLTSIGNADMLMLPALVTLNVSSNQLATLPDMSLWTELTTLIASENRLADFPEGFTSLQRLRIADFASNDITKLDEKIALMQQLEKLLLAANPIRERKFLTMGTDQLKRDLRSRLDLSVVETAGADALSDKVSEATEETLVEEHPWTLQHGGMLNLSAKNLFELDTELFTNFVAHRSVCQLNLQSNRLGLIPPIVASIGQTLTSLNLSKNKIACPLNENLELPSLRELYLGHNVITTDGLHKLTTLLKAPLLHHLDLTYNRLSGPLPVLRSSYPSLVVLSAADNDIEYLSPEALEGLRSVDLRNNSIDKLDPKIGLLGSTLKGLEIEGNRFRVPSYNILKLGTERVLSWLKDKIPENEREEDEQF